MGHRRCGRERDCQHGGCGEQCYPITRAGGRHALRLVRIAHIFSPCEPGLCAVSAHWRNGRQDFRRMTHCFRDCDRHARAPVVVPSATGRDEMHPSGWPDRSVRRRKGTATAPCPAARRDRQPAVAPRGTRRCAASQSAMVSPGANPARCRPVSPKHDLVGSLAGGGHFLPLT